MSVFTAKMLKEARNSAGLSQDEAANAMKISRRKLQLIEANESAISVDDIVEFAVLFTASVKLKLSLFPEVFQFIQIFTTEQL